MSTSSSHNQTRHGRSRPLQAVQSLLEDYSLNNTEAEVLYSLHCQKANEPSHTKVCRAADCRRTLYRAGQTTQLIFQCCQEALSKICITRVEKRGSNLCIYQASDIEKQTLPSLSSIFDTEDDKQAAIACLASDAAITFVRGLLEHMIPGQCHPNFPIPVHSPINIFDISNIPQNSSYASLV